MIKRFRIVVQDPLFGFLADLLELLESHKSVRVA